LDSVTRAARGLEWKIISSAYDIEVANADADNNALITSSKVIKKVM
jgi:hypothetical protein